MQRPQLAAQCTKILRIKVRHVGLARNSVFLEDRRCHRKAFAFQEMLPYIVMRSHDADRRRLAPCTASELPVRFRGCWRVRAHTRPGSRARGTRDRTIGTLADPFKRAARSGALELSRSGRWRTRTREAARPHAHAPARPRSRVVRARTWVRAPPRVLPDAVLKPSARSPRDATKCGPEFLPTVFFSSADRRLVTVTVSGVEYASEGARQKTPRPSAVACSDST